jgi:hypothetical protein
VEGWGRDTHSSALGIQTQQDQSLKVNFIFVSYTSYTCNLKVILYIFKNNFIHETKFHGVEFATVVSNWCSNVSDLGDLGVLGFLIRDAHSE